jgi:hypothetical protein
VSPKIVVVHTHLLDVRIHPQLGLMALVRQRRSNSPLEVCPASQRVLTAGRVVRVLVVHVYERRQRRAHPEHMHPLLLRGAFYIPFKS